MTGILERESCTRIARQIGGLSWGNIYSVVVGRGLIGRLTHVKSDVHCHNGVCVDEVHAGISFFESSLHS
jgi:hypothetical protein